MEHKNQGIWKTHENTTNLVAIKRSFNSQIDRKKITSTSSAQRCHANDDRNHAQHEGQELQATALLEVDDGNFLFDSVTPFSASNRLGFLDGKSRKKLSLSNWLFFVHMWIFIQSVPDIGLWGYQGKTEFQHLNCLRSFRPMFGSFEAQNNLQGRTRLSHIVEKSEQPRKRKAIPLPPTKSMRTNYETTTGSETINFTMVCKRI